MIKRIIIFCFIFLSISSAILAQPISVPSEDNVLSEIVKKRGVIGKELFHKATEFFLNKEYSKAIEYCKKLIAINPNDYETNYLLGLSYAEKGDFRKAVRYYQKSTNVYPNQTMLIAMSITFSNDQNYRTNLDKTIEDYKNEIANNPTNYQVYNDLGYISFILKADPKVEQYYKKSIEIKPNYAQAHYNLAIYYLFNGDKDLALEESKILESLNKDLAKTILKAINSGGK